MGAHADVPGPRQSRGQRRALVLVAVLGSPCLLAFGGLLVTCALMLTMVSLMIDVLFLAPVVAVLHGLLRHLAGG